VVAAPRTTVTAHDANGSLGNDTPWADELYPGIDHVRMYLRYGQASGPAIELIAMIRKAMRFTCRLGGPLGHEAPFDAASRTNAI
jgi:hypothetical protein